MKTYTKMNETTNIVMAKESLSLDTNHTLLIPDEISNKEYKICEIYLNSDNGKMLTK